MKCFLHMQSVAILLFPLVIVLICLWRGGKTKKKGTTTTKQAPEPSGRLPVIGHLHLLCGRKPLSKLFGDMADENGPVFMLRLGTRKRMLVVCDWQAAKDCLLTNDKALATRPRTAAGEYMGYNSAMLGFAPYGDYYRSIRKIAVVQLLSSTRVDMLKHPRYAEIDACVRDLHGLCANSRRRPAMAEMAHRLQVISNNVIDHAVAGKHCFGPGGGSDEALRFRKALERFVHVLLKSFTPVLGDALPFLRPLDWGGREAEMVSAAQEMDALMTGLLEEHRQKRLAGKTAAGGDRDFIDVMLDAVEEGAEFFDMDHDTVIKANALNLMLGGSDNPATVMTRVLALLVNHRQVLVKLQDELDVQVGKGRRVEESEIKQLVYLQAVVKETLRLHPPAPLLIPREAMSDCHIGGFHVPAGTRVLVNVAKLQRDPNVWGDDAGEFNPERFLPPSRHAGVDVMGQHIELIPFGAGRRGCPGILLSMQIVHLTLARLIQGFELEKPAGSLGEGSDYEALFSSHGAALELMITPRLDDALYV